MLYMRKFLLTILAFLFLPCMAFAEDMKVMALTDFSTDSPSEIKVQVLQTVSLDEDVNIEIGSVVVGKMVDIIPAKRLKRDATFSFVPSYFITPAREKFVFNRTYTGKFSPKIEIDKADLAKSAALSVGNFFVKGLTTGFYAVQGAVKDEKGNRLVSSVNNVYENSFLSYFEKGGATCIKAQSMFTFKFDSPKFDDAELSKPALTKEKEPDYIPGFVPGSLPVGHPQY